MSFLYILMGGLGGLGGCKVEMITFTVSSPTQPMCPTPPDPKTVRTAHVAWGIFRQASRQQIDSQRTQMGNGCGAWLVIAVKSEIKIPKTSASSVSVRDFKRKKVRKRRKERKRKEEKCSR